MSLSAAADELYGADPAGFVARRGELVKQARTAGDKALATHIAALRRPTVAAWYMNLLARAGSTELDELIDLGATMRQAQGALDMARVTSLAPRRRELEHAVQRRLDMLLATQGITASPAAWAEVGHTLTAVAADASAAAAVRSGCLARSLVYAGFGEVDLSDAVGAELEAWVDRRAADRDQDEQPESVAEPTIAPEAPAVRVVAVPKPDPEVIAARQRLAEAVDEREGAQREVDEIGLAYAAAQERLRTAQSAVAEAQTALNAREGAGDASAGWRVGCVPPVSSGREARRSWCRDQRRGRGGDRWTGRRRRNAPPPRGACAAGCRSRP